MDSDLARLFRTVVGLADDPRFNFVCFIGGEC
jgi:hypothetical protein